MIIDSSALVAILAAEADMDRYLTAIVDAESAMLSTVTYVETAIVLDRHKDPVAGRQLDAFLARGGIGFAVFTEAQARIARAAYRDFGRGSEHPARLNFGDCVAYALAIETRQPLLFKGNDFTHTDVRDALSESERQ